MKKPGKIKLSKQRQAFLKTFFNGIPGYQEKEVNGFFLVKQVNGATGEEIVAIYTKESFEQYKKTYTPEHFAGLPYKESKKRQKIPNETQEERLDRILTLTGEKE